MGSGKYNYVLESNSDRNGFPGLRIPRSEAPRTANDGLDQSTLLLFLQDTPEGLLDSRIARMRSESERYQNSVYAPEISKLESPVPQTESLQAPPNNTSIKTQNAPVAENRQNQSRIETPEQRNKDEEDDQELSLSEEENRGRCRPY